MWKFVNQSTFGVPFSTNIPDIVNRFYFHQEIKSQEQSKHFIVEDLKALTDENTPQFGYLHQMLYYSLEEFNYAKNYFGKLMSNMSIPFSKKDIAKFIEFHYCPTDTQKGNSLNQVYEFITIFEYGESDRIDIETIQNEQMIKFVRNICMLMSEFHRTTTLYHGNISIKNMILVSDNLKLSGFKPIYVAGDESSYKSWKVQFAKEYGHSRLDIFMIGLIWLKFLEKDIAGAIDYTLNESEVVQNCLQIAEKYQDTLKADLLLKILNVYIYNQIQFDEIIEEMDQFFVLQEIDYQTEIVNDQENSLKLSNINSKNDIDLTLSNNNIFANQLKTSSYESSAQVSKRNTIDSKMQNLKESQFLVSGIRYSLMPRTGSANFPDIPIDIQNLKEQDTSLNEHTATLGQFENYENKSVPILMVNTEEDIANVNQEHFEILSFTQLNNKETALNINILTSNDQLKDRENLNNEESQILKAEDDNSIVYSQDYNANRETSKSEPIESQIANEETKYFEHRKNTLPSSSNLNSIRKENNDAESYNYDETRRQKSSLKSNNNISESFKNFRLEEKAIKSNKNSQKQSSKISLDQKSNDQIIVQILPELRRTDNNEIGLIHQSESSLKIEENQNSTQQELQQQNSQADYMPFNNSLQDSIQHTTTRGGSSNLTPNTVPVNNNSILWDKKHQNDIRSGSLQAQFNPRRSDSLSRKSSSIEKQKSQFVDEVSNNSINYLIEKPIEINNNSQPAIQEKTTSSKSVKTKRVFKIDIGSNSRIEDQSFQQSSFRDLNHSGSQTFNQIPSKKFDSVFQTETDSQQIIKDQSMTEDNKDILTFNESNKQQNLNNRIDSSLKSELYESDIEPQFSKSLIAQKQVVQESQSEYNSPLQESQRKTISEKRSDKDEMLESSISIEKDMDIVKPDIIPNNDSIIESDQSQDQNLKEISNMDEIINNDKEEIQINQSMQSFQNDLSLKSKSNENEQIYSKKSSLSQQLSHNNSQMNKVEILDLKNESIKSQQNYFDKKYEMDSDQSSQNQLESINDIEVVKLNSLNNCDDSIEIMRSKSKSRNNDSRNHSVRSLSLLNQINESQLNDNISQKNDIIEDKLSIQEHIDIEQKQYQQDAIQCDINQEQLSIQEQIDNESKPNEQNEVDENQVSIIEHIDNEQKQDKQKEVDENQLSSKEHIEIEQEQDEQDIIKNDINQDQLLLQKQFDIEQKQDQQKEVDENQLSSKEHIEIEQQQEDQDAEDSVKSESKEKSLKEQISIADLKDDNFPQLGSIQEKDVQINKKESENVSSNNLNIINFLSLENQNDIEQAPRNQPIQQSVGQPIANQPSLLEIDTIESQLINKMSNSELNQEFQNQTIQTVIQEKQNEQNELQHKSSIDNKQSNARQQNSFNEPDNTIGIQLNELQLQNNDEKQSFEVAQISLDRYSNMTDNDDQGYSISSNIKEMITQQSFTTTTNQADVIEQSILKESIKIENYKKKFIKQNKTFENNKVLNFTKKQNQPNTVEIKKESQKKVQIKMNQPESSWQVEKKIKEKKIQIKEKKVEIKDQIYVSIQQIENKITKEPFKNIQNKVTSPTSVQKTESTSIKEFKPLQLNVVPNKIARPISAQKTESTSIKEQNPMPLKAATKRVIKSKPKILVKEQKVVEKQIEQKRSREKKGNISNLTDSKIQRTIQKRQQKKKEEEKNTKIASQPNILQQQIINAVQERYLQLLNEDLNSKISENDMQLIMQKLDISSSSVYFKYLCHLIDTKNVDLKIKQTIMQKSINKNQNFNKTLDLKKHQDQETLIRPSSSDKKLMQLSSKLQNITSNLKEQVQQIISPNVITSKQATPIKSKLLNHTMELSISKKTEDKLTSYSPFSKREKMFEYNYYHQLKDIKYKEIIENFELEKKRLVYDESNQEIQ